MDWGYTYTNIINKSEKGNLCFFFISICHFIQKEIHNINTKSNPFDPRIKISIKIKFIILDKKNKFHLNLTIFFFKYFSISSYFLQFMVLYTFYHVWKVKFTYYTKTENDLHVKIFS